MPKPQKKMWALVKWVGGEDDKTYTVGIDINHIKRFNYQRYIEDDEDPNQIYTVEWHDTAKEPLGGWLCYSAMVIAVSGSLTTLNKKLRALDGIASPKRILDETSTNETHDQSEECSITLTSAPIDGKATDRPVSAATERPGSAATDRPGSAETDRSGSAETDRSGSSAADRSGASAKDHTGPSASDRPGSAETDHPGSSAAERSGASAKDHTSSSASDHPGSSESDHSKSSEKDRTGSSVTDRSKASAKDRTGSSVTDRSKASAKDCPGSSAKKTSRGRSKSPNTVTSSGEESESESEPKNQPKRLKLQSKSRRKIHGETSSEDEVFSTPITARNIRNQQNEDTSSNDETHEEYQTRHFTKKNTKRLNDAYSSQPSTSRSGQDGNFVTVSDFKKAFNEIRDLLKPKLQNQERSRDDRSQRNEDMKELGTPGSGVFIPYSEYSLAESALTPTAMATFLLRAVFSDKVLLSSNYKGGAPKNAKDPLTRHKALDKKKIEAIRETVKQRFGNAFKEGDFGRAINVKCNKLRQLDRQAKAKQRET